MNLTQKIESIVLKTKQLALKLERLEHENVSLKEENSLLKNEINRYIEAAGTLKNKADDTYQALEQKKEERNVSTEYLKEQLSQYIAEIDKCIEWLHNN